MRGDLFCAGRLGGRVLCAPSDRFGKFAAVTVASSHHDEFRWDLAAESITVISRWIGLCVGYALVNLPGDVTNLPVLNAILTLGAVYALVDTWWSIRGRVFLSRWPLVISLMEAVFIGLLCHFHGGLGSPFRFYYFLSLLVCAMRYRPVITFSALGLHTISFSSLLLGDPTGHRTTMFLMLAMMGWVTWASTALAGLVKSAGERLSELNDELTRNQNLLEERIAERTRELQESQALLVQQEKQAAFGLLAAGIAHEVGNPLAAISSLVQMLNRRHTDEYTRERLHMVDDQLLRIQRTLRELVNFSRPATTERSLCDVHQIIEAALNIAKYYKRRKGKRIVTCFARDLPMLRVVRDQLVQVFLNLILNAMDATQEGAEIELATGMEDDWIYATVCDDGHGIAPADQDAIFQPYFTTKESGTGLGLFVCRHLLEQSSDGRIELSESSADGTTFTIWLTCDNVRRAAAVQQNLSTDTAGITYSEDIQPT